MPNCSAFYLSQTMIHMMCRIIYIFLLISITGATDSGIVGGEVAEPHSRPYMASLQFGECHSCGGILIREDFVLTAAHCKQRGTMTVVLGAHDISKKEEIQQRIEVAKYYQHPKYDGKYDNDIMLLKLKNNAKLDKYVKTIELPKKNGKVKANVNCSVAGWGWTEADGHPSKVLKETTEKMQFSFECKTIWQEIFDSTNMICTKFSKKTGGICQGDSGGPLICKTKLKGITSFTFKDDCSNPKYPHVFTKVGAFLPWIEEVMQKSGNVA